MVGNASLNEKESSSEGRFPGNKVLGNLLVSAEYAPSADEGVVLSIKGGFNPFTMKEMGTIEMVIPKEEGVGEYFVISAIKAVLRTSQLTVGEITPRGRVGWLQEKVLFHYNLEIVGIRGIMGFGIRKGSNGEHYLQAIPYF